MALIEKDSIEAGLKNYARFIPSSTLGLNRRGKSQQILATREIMFGFNRKQDNQIKTHQLKLF